MKIFIGVGHGGSDPGAVSYLVEKDVNLVEALACRDFLEAHGVQILGVPYRSIYDILERVHIKRASKIKAKVKTEK